MLREYMQDGSGMFTVLSYLPAADSFGYVLLPRVVCDTRKRPLPRANTAGKRHTSRRHSERGSEGDTVGRHGEGDTVGETVRDTVGRHGEGDTVRETVREAQLRDTVREAQ